MKLSRLGLAIYLAGIVPLFLVIILFDLSSWGVMLAMGIYIVGSLSLLAALGFTQTVNARPSWAAKLLMATAFVGVILSLAVAANVLDGSQPIVYNIRAAVGFAFMASLGLWIVHTAHVFLKCRRSHER